VEGTPSALAFPAGVVLLSLPSEIKSESLEF
jgi:hypothetical protein